MTELEKFRGRELRGVEELTFAASQLVEKYTHEPARGNVRVGITQRIVRHYLSEGLLGAPTGHAGASILFNYGNLLRLLAVKKLLADHWSLVKIREFVSALKDFEKSEGRGSVRVLEGKELNRLDTNPNAAFILEALDGHYFSAGYVGDPTTPAKLKGQHGFLPTRYYTSFIASGAGVRKRGNLGTIRLIDEGPTIAQLLGFKLRDAEGRAISLK